MEENTRRIMESLSIYAEGGNEDIKYHLRDELLDFSERIYKEGAKEGWDYQLMYILARDHEELPQTFREFHYVSPFTKEESSIFIKEIHKLRRNKDGDLIIEVLAKKIR